MVDCRYIALVHGIINQQTSLGGHPLSRETKIEKATVHGFPIAMYVYKRICNTVRYHSSIGLPPTHFNPDMWRVEDYFCLSMDLRQLWGWNKEHDRYYIELFSFFTLISCFFLARKSLFSIALNFSSQIP